MPTSELSHAAPAKNAKVATFSKLFDHSIIRPEVTRQEVAAAAEAAASLRTATLTVQPHYIRFAAPFLKGSGVLLGTVVGFPHGNETPAIKEYAAKTVLDLGAEEIDMVMNIPALRNGEKDVFLADIQGVVRAADGRIVKVILENCYLAQEEKRRACQWIAEAGAHFVKTATAYASGGATLEDVRLMHEAVAGRCRVKAAGGVRQIGEVLEYLRAGATRFGSTRTQQFVQAFRELSEQERQNFGEFIADLGV
ncbi:MAG TPA: deoxyribose-phosphate aldolase [Terriglobales bacterium]|nr:deoxyribose-phosphate aldolase [Terriglobales bacterium]